MSASSFLIAIVPLLLLLASLARRSYPGEAVIERLRGIIEATDQPSDCGVYAGNELLVPGVRRVRGGELIARSLAGRAPPVPA